MKVQTPVKANYIIKYFILAAPAVLSALERGKSMLRHGPSLQLSPLKISRRLLALYCHERRTNKQTLTFTLPFIIIQLLPASLSALKVINYLCSLPQSFLRLDFEVIPTIHPPFCRQLQYLEWQKERRSIMQVIQVFTASRRSVFDV